MLHHKHFDCNYGAMHVPLDYLFGTYAGSKQEVGCSGGDTEHCLGLQVSQIWGSKPSGEEANDTPVHQASQKQDKVQ